MSQKAYLELISGSILFGLVGIFLANIHEMSTGSIIFYKHFAGIIFLSIYFLMSGRTALLRPAKRKRYLLLLGLFNTCTVFAYFVCIRYTTLSVAILLLYTAPMYVTLLSPVFLKEKVGLPGIAALIFSLTGIIFIVDPAGTVHQVDLGGKNLIGFLAGIVSGMCFAGVIITVRYLKDDYTGPAQLFWSTFVGILMLSPAAVDTTIPLLTENIMMIVLFAFVNTAVASILYINGLAKLPAQTSSIIALMEPVSVIFFDHVLLHTPVFFNTMAGCLFILFGAAMASIRNVPIAHENM
ncbi:DMT family transporter [uncultured Methanomethylovorans sp.]|uniref:DMT family transporter n=1 Tax=uncultured Methanomethylovorans sp. TaxID=183759 RepID=UPI002638BF3A|nr:DMT family transporter [uncultured Methanomethylovorans sp.]